MGPGFIPNKDIFTKEFMVEGLDKNPKSRNRVRF